MSTFTNMYNNGYLLHQAETIIDNFVRSGTDEHKVWCYLVNPDGTRIAIQPGFKLENGEYAICYGE